MLPFQAPGVDPSGSLSFQEGVTYLTPTRHYHTPAIDKLKRIVDGLLEGEELFEELEDHLQEMANTFVLFERRYAGEMQALLAQEAERFPDDPLNPQLSYLIRRGFQYFDEGCQSFDKFLDTESDDADELELAFRRVQAGSDYICFALKLADKRMKELQRLARQLAGRDEDAGEPDEALLQD